MKRAIVLAQIMFIAAAVTLVGCQALPLQADPGPLTASGTISATSTRISAEIPGKILDIKADKGGEVKAGDIVLRLDDAILQAQHDQAEASVQVAQTGLDFAKQKQASAQAQYDQTLQAARVQDRQARTNTWQASQLDEIKQPAWYFQKEEQMAATDAEVKAAETAFQIEQANLDQTLKNASNQDFVQAEKRLDQAQVAYTIADTTLQQANDAPWSSELTDAAQKNMDAAQSELDAAQKDYDQMLNSSAAKDVLEARARVAVARARLDNANDASDKAQTGDLSLAVTVAKTGIDQANSAVNQAEAAVAQAQAALKLVELQLEKTNLAAPVSGMVLSRPVNPGETISAGMTLLEVGSLDVVTLTVYIPEDLYGEIALGQQAKIKVDSFPGRQFTGQVTYISDQAEFTPRNVQTVESRSTTVYAVDISINNPQHELKPGMPADATF